MNAEQRKLLEDFLRERSDPVYYPDTWSFQEAIRALLAEYDTLAERCRVLEQDAATRRKLFLDW